MKDKILDPENWELDPIENQLKRVKANRNRKNKINTNAWYNKAKNISPLTLYKYLKDRFGPPNGFIMLLKKRDSDNIIHWQYSFTVSDTIINILGKTSGLELLISTSSDITISEDDWVCITKNLQTGFKKYAQRMGEIQKTFEQWSLFINPFARIEFALKEYVSQLERLNLKEIDEHTRTKEGAKKYLRDLKLWTKNANKAASLGTTIRMLCPVMGESFINLIILVFRKDEYKSDERLYDNLIRQHIDVRIKTLHLNCNCFPNPIDATNDAFKNFHTLMNGRNDLLHGNVEPKSLIVEKVWFDDEFIPLFENAESIIKKTLKNFCTNVEREKAINDFQIISNFIELILMSMDDNSFKTFLQFMADRMPGINKKTNRLGILFPSQRLVEGFVY